MSPLFPPATKSPILVGIMFVASFNWLTSVLIIFVVSVKFERSVGITPPTSVSSPTSCSVIFLQAPFTYASTCPSVVLTTINPSVVNPDLPAIKIEVLGPPPTSGTRDAFSELALEKGGCKKIKWIKALKKKNKQEYKSKCHTTREDGPFIEAGENDNLMVQKLVSNPNALAIFGFSFLDQNADKVQGATINGIEPAFENISSGKYPISRPLFFYIKNAHVGIIPGMLEYVEEFLSDAASGEDGYLGEKGLISMPDSERAELNPKVLDLSLIVGDISPSKLK